MTRRFQFSLGALFAITAVVGAVLGLSELIGPSSVGMLAGFAFTIFMVVRWPTKGFLLGVIFMWGSVFLGAYIESVFGLESFGEALTNAVFLGIWSALGWLFAAIYLTPIYLLRLALGYWRGRMLQNQQAQTVDCKDGPSAESVGDSGCRSSGGVRFQGISGQINARRNARTK